MDSCMAVEKELDKVVNKFSTLQENSARSFDELIAYMQTIEGQLTQDCSVDGESMDHESSLDDKISAEKALMLAQCFKRVKDTVSRLATDHRDLHSSVSKVGKAIDRNFVADFGATGIDDAFGDPDKARLLNMVICEHFYRQGMLDIGEELDREAKLVIGQQKKEPFFELNRILEALKERDLRPALAWANRNGERLQEQASSLEFKLHRLRFIDLISQGSCHQTEAIDYARQNFPRFASQREQDIQVLMGSLLYIRQGIADSPYNFLLDPSQWGEICEVFMRDACALLGLSVDSPLAVCINSSCLALPSLLNIKQVMMQRQVAGVWTSRDELPIEIDLGKEFRYHSIFACPILRQQSSENNPPMRLVCGHVVSRDALHKLANGNKLKCPYCPVEQNPADARLVRF